MPENELPGAALVRIKHGESITSMVRSVFGNVRQYRAKTTEMERAEISRARTEYLAAKPMEKRTVSDPRLIVETRPELRQQLNDHCKANGIKVSTFVRKAIKDALNTPKKN
ncbi:hypothetical protein [Spirosoma arcticum]